MTRQFPNPDPATQLVEDRRYPIGRIQVVVPETDCRRSHIDLIDPTHPLLPFATNCLSYDEGERPSACDLSHCLAALKQAPQYGESVQQTQERSRPAQDTDREEGERRIRELQQQQEEQVQETHHLQQQVEARDQQLQASENLLQENKDRQLEEKDQAIAHSEQQMRQLQQQHSEQIGRFGNLRPLHQRITELLEQHDHHMEETQ